MSNKLTEQQVLRELNISGFSHITKDNFMKLVSMLPLMAPEVKKMALEQIPDFAQTMLEAMNECKERVEKEALAANTESFKSCMDSINAVINSLQSCLHKDNLPFEEKIYCIEKLMELAGIAATKDSENKKFILQLILGIPLTLAIILALIAAGAAAAGLPFGNGKGSDEDSDIYHIDPDDIRPVHQPCKKGL